jgi:hypothetical protein
VLQHGSGIQRRKGAQRTFDPRRHRPRAGLLLQPGREQQRREPGPDEQERSEDMGRKSPATGADVQQRENQHRVVEERGRMQLDGEPLHGARRVEEPDRPSPRREGRQQQRRRDRRLDPVRMEEHQPLMGRDRRKRGRYRDAQAQLRARKRAAQEKEKHILERCDGRHEHARRGQGRDEPQGNGLQPEPGGAQVGPEVHRRAHQGKRFASR